jgi:hypothetical protein
VAVAALDPDAVFDVLGSFAGYGVDVPVALTAHAGAPGGVRASGDAAAGLPLPLLIAGWLRGQVGQDEISVQVAPVPPGSDPAECQRIGIELAQRLHADGEPVGLLVLGDGAAKHTVRAPGHFDHRAADFDKAVATALAGADPGALLALDPVLADELWVAGREAWQVGAAAAQALSPAWRGELLYSDAPYGVCYHVALWVPGGAAGSVSDAGDVRSPGDREPSP